MKNKNTGEVTEIKRFNDKELCPKFNTNSNNKKHISHDEWCIVMQNTLQEQQGCWHMPYDKMQKPHKDDWYISVRKIHHNVDDFDVISLSSSDNDVESMAMQSDNNTSSLLGSTTSIFTNLF